jgi:hypothetical protein
MSERRVDEVERDGGPAPREIMQDPEVRANVERALARVREGKAKRGKTGEELLNQWRGERELDA